MRQILWFFINSLFIFDMLLIGLVTVARFPRRKLFWVRFPISVAVCVVASYYFSQWNGQIFQNLDLSILQGLTGYLLQFALLIGVFLVCFRMSLWKALYVGAAGYFIQHASYIIDRLIRGEIAGDAWNWWILLSHFLLLGAVYFVVWLLFLRRVDGEALDKINLRKIGPIVVIMLAACLLLNLIANDLGQNQTAFQLADLTCNILGLFYQYSVLSVFVLERKNEKVEQLLEQSVHQYNVSKENIELINIRCHDLRHQIRDFHREGKIDEALMGEIERVVDNYDCTMRTGNGALDVILTEKSLLCRSKNIRFTCVADGTGLSYMNSYDLYALFGNAIENAMEAVEQIDDPEKRVIGLTMHAIGGFYSVNLQNYVSYAVVLDGEGLPVTHKEDKQNHGFGVRSMNMLAEKYGGALSYRVEGNVFNLNMVLPYRKPDATQAAEDRAGERDRI